MKILLKFIGKLSINKRMLLLQFIGCAALIVAFSIAYLQVNQIYANNDEANKEHAHLERLHESKIILQQMKLLTDSYTSTKTDASLSKIEELITVLKTKNIPSQHFGTINDTASALIAGASKNEDDHNHGLNFVAAIDVVGGAIDSKIITQQRQLKNYTSRLIQAKQAFTLNLIIYAVVTISFCAFLGFLITRSMISPLVSLTTALNLLADGSKDVVVPRYKSKDEIGVLSIAASKFQRLVDHNSDLAGKHTEDANRAEQRANKLENLIAKFKAQAKNTINDVNDGTVLADKSVGRMESITTSTLDQSSIIASIGEETSETLNVISKAANELSASSQNIEKQAKRTINVASDASDQVNKTSDKISGLSSATGQINNMVSLIQDIAERTNLLALNATIEAARAGDAGRGFSVVAQEVKALANQTAQATSQISTHVENILSETAGAVDSVEAIKEIVKKVDDATNHIASAVEEQNASTTKIAQSVSDVTTKANLVQEHITKVTERANDGVESISDIRAAYREIKREFGELNGSIDGFLQDVKSIEAA